MDLCMHQHPVRSNACLAGIPEFGVHTPLDGEVDVRGLEYYEGGVPSQLQRYLFHCGCALAVQDLAHVGGTGEGQGSDLEQIIKLVYNGNVPCVPQTLQTVK